METYLPFNPLSTIRVEETRIVEGCQVVLRHIPKRGSVVINGFVEVDSDPAPYQFSCQYSDDSVYREANRVLIFNPANNAQEFLISYIAVGTVITADDMNEIKAHLENDSLHGGGSDGYFKDNSTKMIYAGGLDFRNIDDEYWAIDSRIGRGLDEAFQSEVGRAPQVGDIVQYYAPGNDVGYTIRTTDKWVNLGYYSENDTSWDAINPLLTIKDRQKLDSINAQIDAWQYKGKFNNRPDFSDEDDTDIAIYLQCEDNDTFPDGSAPEVGYYSLQDIPFTYYDMAFHNDDLLFYLPLANGSKKWFVMQSAANYRDYYTYRHPTILPDYPARGTENTNDKHPPEGNLWFDEDGKLHLAGKDYNLYTFTPDPPANRFSANLSLTENDRKLLDYLHTQFDSEIPT